MNNSFLSIPFVIKILEECPKQVNPPNAPSGLYVIPEWILRHQEPMLINEIMSKQFSSELSAKRLTQHYGKKYTGTHFQDKDALPIDGYIKLVAERIEKGLPGINITQVLVNKYNADTGIGSHIDRNQPIVFGVSLGADTNMIWTNVVNGSKYEALVPARSLYVMIGEASSIWEHSVPTRKTISYGTQKINKGENYCRISITFRHFLTSNVELPSSSPVINYHQI